MTSQDASELRRRAFDAFAAHYDKVRPGYPEAVCDEIERFCRLTRASRILEIGPGTGQATRLFARRGLAVTAVEPSPALAALARANLAAFPGVDVLEQSFEETKLPDEPYDLIFAAQSFHWVDSPLGFEKAHRLLSQRGSLAVFWNLKCPLASPLQESFEQVYRRFFRAEPWFCMNEDCLARARQERTKRIETSGLFSVSASRDFTWSRRYTREEYLELIESYADHRLLAEPWKTSLCRGIAAAIDAQGGVLDIPYTTVLFLCTPRYGGHRARRAVP